LCCGEGRNFRALARPLPHRFVDVHRDLSIASGGALRFLCTPAERHYAPWTRSRQEQIEADLQKAWRRARKLYKRFSSIT
jgi:hypothetical protein